MDDLHLETLRAIRDDVRQGLRALVILGWLCVFLLGAIAFKG